MISKGEMEFRDRLESLSRESSVRIAVPVCQRIRMIIYSARF
jgi:hypothetical protein